jgi:hypothetical protein
MLRHRFKKLFGYCKMRSAIHFAAFRWFFLVAVTLGGGCGSTQISSKNGNDEFGPLPSVEENTVYWKQFQMKAIAENGEMECVGRCKVHTYRNASNQECISWLPSEIEAECNGAPDADWLKDEKEIVVCGRDALWELENPLNGVSYCLVKKERSRSNPSEWKVALECVWKLRMSNRNENDPSDGSAIYELY